MANTGLVASNPANQATGQDVHTRSKFPFGYKFADTHRFGEYHPFFAMEAVEGDKIDLHCAHDVRSMTLKAPLLQDISMKKDYFIVPREAILPLNWDKFYTIPTIGDDVSDDVGTCVVGFWSKTCAAFNSLLAMLNGNSAPTGNDYITGLFRTLIFGEMFFSEGSLLSTLHAHGGVHFRCVASGSTGNYFSIGAAKWSLTYDDFFDTYVRFFIQEVDKFTLTLYDDAGNTTSYVVKTSLIPVDSVLNLGSGRSTEISMRIAIQMMRDNPFSISGLTKKDGSAFSTAELTHLVNDFMDTFNDHIIEVEGEVVTIKSLWSYLGAVVGVEDEDKLDLARLHAYNIVCCHFYSNDHVDYVYSAQLYRQLINYYVNILNESLSLTTSDVSFVYNGILYQYDALSSYNYGQVVGIVDNYANNYLSGTELTQLCLISYFQQIFGFRRSLRFLDYFTGARSLPLAVAQQTIDINVDGTAGTGYSVSAINVTKGIQAQRLANAVNRFGRKFEDYIAGMSGKKPAPDYHNPFYLAHTSDVVYGQESEFTQGLEYATQQNISSVLRSSGGKYAFQIECDRPSIVIGICYYDIERFYGRTTERQFFHANRYDMFNKYMQFIGDQPIYCAELGITGSNMIPVDGTFAYTNRHMEYKQRYSQCAGGFNVPSTDLDLWLYKTDNYNLSNLTQHISPSYIRSWNIELDKYYLNLSGYSLGTYWHFVVKNINFCEANRPMAYAPSIL